MTHMISLLLLPFSFQSDMKFATLKTQNMQHLKVCYCCMAFLLAETRPVLSNDGIQIGPNVRLPPTYDVQVFPSSPVPVNMSVVLFEIVSVNEPEQVQYKITIVLQHRHFFKNSYFPCTAFAPSDRL